jgi:hypothetical protein
LRPLRPRDTADSLLGQSQLWCDEDFEPEGDEAEDQQQDASDLASIDAQADTDPSAYVPKTSQRVDLLVSGRRAGYAEPS